MNEELLVGGNAFKAMLTNINPDTQIPKLKADYASAKSVSAKDTIVKKLKYLSGLKRIDINAADAFVINHVPVIPPASRPATSMSGNRIEFADVNQLYKDHMLVNNSLKDVVDDLTPDMLIKERSENYAGLKAVVGLGDAISPNSSGRGLKGLLRQVSGEAGPKGGFFHSKVLSKKQDFSARGTIYSEPHLGFNEAAIPEGMIWNTYKFHILRDLSKRGLDYVASEKAWTDKSPIAVASFNKVIQEVPIIINRAPTLMQSNITAFFPKPTKGKSIGVNPLMLPMFAGCNCPSLGN